MASRRETRSHEPINLDEAFDMALKPGSWSSLLPEPSPTGLSDEEDARRHLATRFDDELAYCTNCEITVNAVAAGGHCHRCSDMLSPIGTPPRRRKHT